MAARIWSINTFDWLFLSSVNIFVVFCLALIVLPVGKIRLGGDTAKPDYSRSSWFAILFAAGMGIGLMFWSVAEPIGYYTEWYGSPLNIASGTVEAERAAMAATMYHWGLHPWAIYGVVGLALAFFTYNKGLPLTIRSTFYPLLGNRIYGPIGNIIDITAVIATIFGPATSLGFGAQQAAGGLNYLFGIPADLGTQTGIIVVVTAVALFSVTRGLDGGVKLMSNINMVLAAALLLFVIFAGSLMTFLSTLGTTFVAYAEYFLPLSNPVGREDETFYHGWTIFYWAWWISWSPFVGMFIAHLQGSYGSGISHHRSHRTHPGNVRLDECLWWQWTSTDKSTRWCPGRWHQRFFTDPVSDAGEPAAVRNHVCPGDCAGAGILRDLLRLWLIGHR
ncbi:choline/carnitine/betaine transport family protein [Marinobacter sp. ELB17]|nr:choline/carnitine/betaine transport family protein [Marinobacter sp. ELB17]